VYEYLKVLLERVIVKVEFNAKFAAEPVDIVSETLDRYETQRAVESASLSWLMPLMFAPILADDAFAAERAESLFGDWSAADDIFAAFETGNAASEIAAVQTAAETAFTEDALPYVADVDLLGIAEDLYAVTSAQLFEQNAESSTFVADSFEQADIGFENLVISEQEAIITAMLLDAEIDPVATTIPMIYELDGFTLLTPEIDGSFI